MTILTFSSCLDELGGAVSSQLREDDPVASAERAAHAPGRACADRGAGGRPRCTEPRSLIHIVPIALPASARA